MKVLVVSLFFVAFIIPSDSNAQLIATTVRCSQSGSRPQAAITSVSNSSASTALNNAVDAGLKNVQESCNKLGFSWGRIVKVNFSVERSIVIKKVMAASTSGSVWGGTMTKVPVFRPDGYVSFCCE